MTDVPIAPAAPAEAPPTSADEAFDKALDSFDPFPDKEEDLEPEEREAAKAEKKTDESEDADEPAEAAVEDDEDEDAQASDDDEEETEAEEDSDEDEREGDEDELDEAYATLLALPKHLRPSLSALKSMPRQKLIAWAQRVEEHEAANAQSSSDADRGREATEATKGSNDTPEKEPVSNAWAALRAGIANTLGVSEEAADGLKPMHDTIESLRAEVAELRSESRARDGQAKISANLQRLGKDYPALLTDKTLRDKLVQKATALAKTGEYTDAESVFNDAVALVPKLKKSKANASELSRKRRNGVSTPPFERGGAYGSPASSEEEDFMKRMDLVESGQFRRAMGLPPPLRDQTRKRKR